MNGRTRLRVWSEEQRRWRTVYVLPGMVGWNCQQLEMLGFLVRVG